MRIMPRVCELDVRVTMPRHSVIGRPVCSMTHAPRFSSGTNNRSRSRGEALTIFTAFAAGADHVAQCLHGRAAIDIADGIKIRIGRLQGLEFRRRAAFLEGTAGVGVGEEDELGRV